MWLPHAIKGALAADCPRPRWGAMAGNNCRAVEHGDGGAQHQGYLIKAHQVRVELAERGRAAEV